MPLFFRKADYLILNRGAVSGTYTVNFSAVKGRTVNIIENYLLCIFIGICNVAGQLVFRGIDSVKGKGDNSFVTVLTFKV